MIRRIVLDVDGEEGLMVGRKSTRSVSDSGRLIRWSRVAVLRWCEYGLRWIGNADERGSMGILIRVRARSWVE